MKYVCTNCNYVYDESIWDIEEEIKAWTKFYELGDYFSCPVCYEWSENFDLIKEEINYIESDNPIDIFEIEHFPIIKIENSILTVVVWKDNRHSMLDEHYISSISLMDEYGDLIEEKFLEPWDNPKVKFEFDNFDEFEIVVRCTFHWLWGFRFVI
jgi:rubredoxin